MKRTRHVLVAAVAFAALLAGCSTNSPTAPKPSPTPAALSIALAPEVSEAKVSDTVIITATVTAGGNAVPDNTSVTFNTADPYYFLFNGDQRKEVVVATTSGKAVAHLFGRQAGIANVTARSGAASVTVSVKFDDATDPRNLQIYSVVPARGKPEGGDTVTIYGYGFLDPMVTFVTGKAELIAQVLSVNKTGTQMQVLSPAPDQDTAKIQEQPAVVRITETYKEVVDSKPVDKTITAELANGFTYNKYNPEPQIFYLSPSRGAWSGGEKVLIYGANFKPPLKVLFGSDEAYVFADSLDAGQTTFQVQTPKHTTSLSGENAVTVTIYTAYGMADQKVTNLNNGFVFIPEVGEPLLYSVVPTKGRSAGGETVTLTGKFFSEPLRVELVCADPVNATLQGQVLGSTHNADGTDTLRFVTPQASVTPVLKDVAVDIRVTNLVGAPESKVATFTRAFYFVAEAGQPLIYYLDPNRGSVEGNEEVTIHGKNFIKPVRVFFESYEARVQSVSDDGTEIKVLTPTVITNPPTGPITVKVTTQADTGRDQSVTLSGAFQYAEGEVPQLYSLTPNNGPLEGGTRVTILGKGFLYPVQVTFTGSSFGEKLAQVVSSNYNQIVCITPSITPSEPTTPSVAQVFVTNQKTGKKSTTSLPFRYGEALFISGITPNRGSMEGGTTFTIFGQGFVAPLTVTIRVSGGGLQAQVLSVSGTEIVAKTAPVPIASRSCASQAGEVEVKLLGSNLSATGPTFTYQATQPLITAVTVDGSGTNYIPEYNVVPPNNCTTTWTSHTIHVTGSGFERRGETYQSSMVVTIAGITMQIPTTWVSDTEVTFQLPDLTAIALQQISCITGGACGSQYVDTPLDLTITNTVSGCSDTLKSAMYIRPCDTTCRPTAISTITITAPATVSQNVAFTLTVGFTPTPLVAPVTVNLQYAGFNGIPANFTIPAGVPSPWLVSVTATSVGSGNIIASTGAGVCARTATSAVITVTPPAPTVGSVTPNFGPLAGGTNVTISGTNFVAGATVTFGGVAATNVVVAGPNTITCTTPAGAAPGPVNVVVTTSGGTGTGANAFTYSPTLTVNKSGATAPAATITSNPAGINCGGTCSASFTYNASVTLTSAPAPTTWGGDCGACTGATCTLTMSANRTCAVTYP